MFSHHRVESLVATRLARHALRRPSRHYCWRRLCSPNAFAHVATHQQSTLGANVVAKGHFGNITAIEGDQRAAQETAEPDAAIAFVRCQAICVALRIVEFLLTSLNVDIGIGTITVADLRGARHPEAVFVTACWIDGLTSNGNFPGPSKALIWPAVLT
jgi:hypothetical protein